MIQHLRTQGNKVLNLALHGKHKARISQLRTDVEKAFTEHPESTGETYLQHLWFTAKMSARFTYSGAAIVLHGLLPFLCTRTASNQIEQIYRIMKTRIPLKRREEIDQEMRLPIYIRTAHGRACVAIVGGGFSGALTLANLIDKADGDLAIEWFDSVNTLGTGVAYGTRHPVHLLNVRASRMGAFAGKPEGFLEWLHTEEGAAHAGEFWPGRAVAAEDFLPRALYARYLQHIVEQALAEARRKNITVRLHCATVTDAVLHDAQSQQITLKIEQDNLDQEVLADAVVLATGNLPPRNFHFQTSLMAGERHYVENIWTLPEGHVYPGGVQEFSADSEIVIIGSGLTMVDTVLTLKSYGFKGVITAISRNGLLPAAHADSKPYQAWDWVLAPQFAPRTALGLLVRLRQEIRQAEKQGYDWRSVIDSLRPATQQLWKQLDTSEKRKFLSRLLTLWNVHRHRMSPEVHGEFKAMQQSGSLRIIAGKIYYVGSDKDGLTVAFRKRGTNRVETLRPVLVVNCTGPEYDIAASASPLLRNLRDRELVTVGPLRAGIEVTGHGSAKGRASDALFPIGTLMVGELLECTAVPELREQAEDVAHKALHRIRSLYEHGGGKTKISLGQGI